MPIHFYGDLFTILTARHSFAHILFPIMGLQKPPPPIFSYLAKLLHLMDKFLVGCKDYSLLEVYRVESDKACQYCGDFSAVFVLFLIIRLSTTGEGPMSIA